MTRDCPLDLEHGDLSIGIDGRLYCERCGYVAVVCDPE